MKATLCSAAPTDPGWAAEFKWDGMRVQVATDGQEVALRSGNGRLVTSTFPELAGLGRSIGVPAVIDGEVVTLDGDRPSFRRLQHRIHVHDPSPSLVKSHPVSYMAFDLLSLDGHSVVDLDYVTRRRLLDDVLPSKPRWHVPPYLVDGGAELLAMATQRELEGIMMKRVDGPYRSGGRSRDWLKVKIRQHQEFVVGGWLAGQGELANQMGSLMVGVWDGSSLVMAGRVGSGLTDAERARLEARFIPRTDSPFVAIPPLDRQPGWVEPDTVVEVAFSEWPDNGSIRHPTYLGIRTDTDAGGVVREVAAPPTGGDR